MKKGNCPCLLRNSWNVLRQPWVCWNYNKTCRRRRNYHHLWCSKNPNRQPLWGPPVLPAGAESSSPPQTPLGLRLPSHPTSSGYPKALWKGNGNKKRKGRSSMCSRDWTWYPHQITKEKMPTLKPRNTQLSYLQEVPSVIPSNLRL